MKKIRAQWREVKTHFIFEICFSHIRTSSYFLSMISQFCCRFSTKISQVQRRSISCWSDFANGSPKLPENDITSCFHFLCFYCFPWSHLNKYSQRPLSQIRHGQSINNVFHFLDWFASTPFCTMFFDDLTIFIAGLVLTFYRFEDDQLSCRSDFQGSPLFSEDMPP